MNLEGTAHVPGFGTVPKKQLAIAGAGVALFAAIYVYRKRKSAASAGSTDAGSGGSPSAPTDPATGYPTGSPEDTAALQAAQLASASYGAGAGGGGGGGGALSVPPAGSTGFSTNASWAQAAEAYLTQSGGADMATVSAALGKYLTGQQVTDAQASIIQQAIAFEGYPPVAGADSYPPSIRQAAAPTPTPTPTPVPDAVPKAPTHLQELGPATKSAVRVSWDASTGATHYELHMDGRTISSHPETWATVGGLKPGTRHTFQVFAISAHGKKSPGSATLTATTAK